MRLVEFNDTKGRAWKIHFRGNPHSTFFMHFCATMPRKDE